MTAVEDLREDETLPALLPNSDTYGRVAEFLHHEAELLDSYRLVDWLALFSEDVVYRMPVRTTQFLVDGEGFHEFDFFADDHQTLLTRVRRLETEFAWAETPPSRTRHFVSNLRLTHDPESGELATRVNFLITRTRQDMDYQMFTGVRHDRLVPDGDGFRIRRRMILVDQTVITATNLSVLF
ncbi:aromatic-ring-hydroxylating dioxygenase subunit beta [Streptomyces sp. NPDC050560]|uniref:aromatic-ring-hydroxylating dioxygenase subunit beta n=1 Tax=Streptomyces sp. NPDC050560 TaxID=3365630 RepID=UPI0037B401BD